MSTRLPWLIAALACFSPLARGQEPNKPTPSASASNPAQPAPGHSVHGEAFDEGPRQKAHIMPGMGKTAFAATSPNAEAVAFINQGVAQLHSFYFLEAERSFRQAAKLDPDCAMAYWGMAMANANNGKRAKGFIKEAQAKAAKRPPTVREKLYIDALAAKHADGGNDKDRRQNWLKGLETIVQDHPTDLDARAWLAMVTWENAGQDGIGSRQAVDTLLGTILDVEPMHPGAHHYRIHLWDGTKPIRAVHSAALYGKAAPGIAHAWHMPGHTYTGLKRYADAAYQQEASARVDHASMTRERTMPFEIHNYAHNNQWLCTSLSHVGRAKDAVTVARDLVEQPRDPQKNGKNDGGSAQRSGRERWTEVLVRYELWDDLIAAIESNSLDFSDIPHEKRQRAYLLGLGYAARGDKTKLDEQIIALKDMIAPPEEKKPQPKPEENKGPAKPEEKKEQAKDTAKAEPKKPEPPKKTTVPGAPEALAELEGLRRWLDGDREGALKSFEKAGAMRKETLARYQLEAGKGDAAEASARKNVDSNPEQLPPLVALVEILEARGKTADARKTFEKLVPFLASADADTPPLKRLAALSAAWRTKDGWNAPAYTPPTDEAAANRIDLATLGPLTWTPYPAEPLAGVDNEGKPWDLASYRGKNGVIALFHLGGKCAHCMQQLTDFGKAIEDFRKLGFEVVAVSTDDAEAVRALKANADGVKFPMPILADPGMAAFRAYRAYDDFEDRAMHGTYLIDKAGGMRFHRIGPEPFLDVEFLKAEAERVGRLVP